MKSFISNAAIGAGVFLAATAFIVLVTFGATELIDLLVSSFGVIAAVVIFSAIVTVLFGICYAVGMRIAGVR